MNELEEKKASQQSEKGSIEPLQELEATELLEEQLLSPKKTEVQEEFDKRIKEVYDWYYSLKLKAPIKKRIIPKIGTHDGKDVYSTKNYGGIFPPVLVEPPSWNAEADGFRLFSGEFNVPSDRVIIYVDYLCVSPYCGWCYHPGGGYEKDVNISHGGTKATWRRHYQGLPVSEYYTVYWKFVP